MNNIKNVETMLEYLQQEQESCFSDTNNLDQPLMDDYTYKQMRKEGEAAIGISVDHVEKDENGNNTIYLFRNLKYRKYSNEQGPVLQKIRK